MSELVEFLLARIAEDEQGAAECSLLGGGREWTDDDGEISSAGDFVSHPSMVAYADHIARHDPTRVLAECEAKRRIVELYRGVVDEPDEWGWEEWRGANGVAEDTLRALASVYAGHADWREEWRV